MIGINLDRFLDRLVLQRVEKSLMKLGDIGVGDMIGRLGLTRYVNHALLYHVANCTHPFNRVPIKNTIYLEARDEIR